MMEQLWGPRSQPPAGAPASVASPRAEAEPAQGEWQSVQRRLEALEARVEQLQVALDRQAAQTGAALARANEVGEAVAGITRITKLWTARRKA